MLMLPYSAPRSRKFTTHLYCQIGGSIHLPPHGCHALQTIDVFKDIMGLPGIGSQPQHISLLAYATNAVLKRTDLIPDMAYKYGLPYLSAHRAPLHQCLLECATRLRAAIRLDRSGCSPCIQHCHQADMIIRADGENSSCRSILLGRLDPPLHFGHKIFSYHIPLTDMDDECLGLGALRTDPGTS